MVLLHIKQASEPSPKLIIVAIGTHGNNGGHEIAMPHLNVKRYLIKLPNYSKLGLLIKK